GDDELVDAYRQRSVDFARGLGPDLLAHLRSGHLRFGHGRLTGAPPDHATDAHGAQRTVTNPSKSDIDRDTPKPPHPVRGRRAMSARELEEDRLLVRSALDADVEAVDPIPLGPGEQGGAPLRVQRRQEGVALGEIDPGKQM